MKTSPSQAYEAAVRQIMTRGLSHDDAVQVLERLAQGHLADNAHALEHYGLDYGMAFGALTAARGSLGAHGDDLDPGHGSTANTLAILGVTLAGIAYSLSKSSYAQAIEHGQQTPLVFQALFTASGGCLLWALLKWLRS
ncbi:MAG: hypothetical protein IAE82_04330 [Opitutaceae bacterium]|nr:hypothetical protein [Opitutaceae bacterium]